MQDLLDIVVADEFANYELRTQLIRVQSTIAASGSPGTLMGQLAELEQLARDRGAQHIVQAVFARRLGLSVTMKRWTDVDKVLRDQLAFATTIDERIAVHLGACELLEPHKPELAMGHLARAIELRPFDDTLLAELERRATIKSGAQLVVDAHLRRADLSTQREQQLAHLRRAGETTDALMPADSRQRAQVWRRVLELDPSDVAAQHNVDRAGKNRGWLSSLLGRNN